MCLFLLARMRAEERVTAALAGLRADRVQMEAASERLAPVLLDLHRGDDWNALAGRPDETATSGQVELRRYALDPWPGLWLEVPIGANGYAERARFVRRGAPIRAGSLEALAPWAHVRDEVLADHPLVLAEAWAWWEEYRSPAGLYVAFDWGLLQRVWT